jgi:hypothetical protein
MSITDICAAIVEIGKGVSGIVSATDPPPPKIDTAQMPALYVLTGSAEYDDEHINEEHRQYRVRVAIAPTGEANPQLLETHLRILIPLVKLAFLIEPTLNRAALLCTVLGDSGVILLPEYSAVGFEVRLEVWDVA